MRTFNWINLFGSFVVLLLSGCATTRYIANPAVPLEIFGMLGRMDDIEVQIRHIIAPGGPGTWLEGAKWNEFVLGIRSTTERDLKISEIKLVDSRGLYVATTLPTVLNLAMASDHATKQISRQTVSTVASAAIMLFPRIGGLLAAGLPGLIGQNALAMAPFADQYLEQKDREAIENEFIKRRLPVPLAIVGRASVNGSVFFPMVSQPRSLVVSFSTLSGNNQVIIPLESGDIANFNDVVKKSEQ